MAFSSIILSRLFGDTDFAPTSCSTTDAVTARAYRPNDSKILDWQHVFFTPSFHCQLRDFFIPYTFVNFGNGYTEVNRF